MTNEGWVTDPEAIRTLVMLKLLKSGDEVKLKQCQAYGCPARLEGQVATIHPPTELVWDTERWPDVDVTQGYATPVAYVGECYIAVWNIAAWRRPLKEKTDAK
jgi:hypothetical protein